MSASGRGPADPCHCGHHRQDHRATHTDTPCTVEACNCWVFRYSEANDLRAAIDRARAEAEAHRAAASVFAKDLDDKKGLFRKAEREIAGWKKRAAGLEGQVGRLREALQTIDNGDCEQVDLMNEPPCGDCAPCLVRSALSSTPTTLWISPEEQKRREDAMVRAARNSVCTTDEANNIEQAMRAAVKP